MADIERRKRDDKRERETTRESPGGRGSYTGGGMSAERRGRRDATARDGGKAGRLRTGFEDGSGERTPHACRGSGRNGSGRPTEGIIGAQREEGVRVAGAVEATGKVVAAAAVASDHDLRTFVTEEEKGAALPLDDSAMDIRDFFSRRS